MAKFELKLPKMGESVAEATLTSWLKNLGDTIEADEAVLEIATDKVDSEVPSEVDGVLVQKFFEIDDVISVGQTIAIIETAEEDTKDDSVAADTIPIENSAVASIKNDIEVAKDLLQSPAPNEITPRFYSPLVKNIAKKEGITIEELHSVPGTGKDSRVTKKDILDYLATRVSSAKTIAPQNSVPVVVADNPVQTLSTSTGQDEIIEMTRMGKLISKHMTQSVQTAAHVQSFIEVDVTRIWNWRNSIKAQYKSRQGENLTFTPIFMEAVAIALKQHPMLNATIEGDTIRIRKNINLGMATALADGNLIVPVIKNADQLNLSGMSKQVNNLALKARTNQLAPDDVQDGSYTVTNVGSFGSIMGTPIINQPQVGILAIGAIRKTPAVIETSEGDFIGIRHKLFLSHSYDHRIINGALGGQFIKTIKEYLESWDVKRQL